MKRQEKMNCIPALGKWLPLQLLLLCQLFLLGHADTDSCAPSQVLIGSACIECSSLFGNCFSCSFSGDSVNSLQCDTCAAGLFRLVVPAVNLKDPNLPAEPTTLCVANCHDFAYNYAPDENHMSCAYCGEHCVRCSSEYGCLDSYYEDHGFKKATPDEYPSGRGLFQMEPPTEEFSVMLPCADDRCDQCSTLDAEIIGLDSPYEQCDRCYQWINQFTLEDQSQKTCKLCDPTSIENCLMCDSENPNNCLSCQEGYVTNFARSKCNPCPPQFAANCKRCSATQCEVCKEGFYKDRQGVCTPCQILPQSNDLGVLQDRCTQCSSANPRTCAYCNQGFKGSMKNPNQCELTCNEGQYPFVSFKTEYLDQNVVEQTQCLQCHKSCKTCAFSDEPTACLSCNENQVLQKTNNTDGGGYCEDRVDTETKQIDIFVSSKVPQQYKSLMSTDNLGTFENPVWNLFDAIEMAKDFAGQYSASSTIVVSIHLFKGDHYALRDRGDSGLYYKKMKMKNNQNLNYFIDIKPLSCYFSRLNMTTEILKDFCTEDQITIYNKQRDRFSIEVPRGISLFNIHIDSLDSVLFELPVLPKCLKEMRNCCQVDDATGQVYSVDADGTCEQAIDNFKEGMDQRCDTNAKHSMFRMVLNDQQEIIEPQQFYLVGSRISNVMFPLHSLVNMKPLWIEAKVLDSTIDNISICGALFKNYYKPIGYPQIDPHLETDLLTDDQIRGITRKQDIEKQNSHQWMNYIPDNVICKATLCHMIEFEKTTFSRIPAFMKPVDLVNLVADENGLRQQGLVLSLDNFPGEVTIKDCVFKDNQIRVSKCIDPTTLHNDDSKIDQLHNPSADFDKAQITSLFAFTNMEGIVRLDGNLFENNVMTAGLIRIDSIGYSYIENNIFKSNSALFDQTIMVSRQCWGMNLDNNVYEDNCGCQGTGLLTVQCTLADENFVYDKVIDSYTVKDKGTALAGSQVHLKRQHIRQNFVGLGKSLIRIEGYDELYIEDSLIEGNQNFLPQTFKEFSPVYTQFDQSEQSNYEDVEDILEYEGKGKSILGMSLGSLLHLKNVTFNNNWVSETKTPMDDGQSNGLALYDFHGSLTFLNSSFDNSRGCCSSSDDPSTSKLNKLKGITGETNVRGIRGTLILLYGSDLNNLHVDGLRFKGNHLYYDPYDKNSTRPYLADFGQDKIFMNYILFNKLQLIENHCENTEEILKFNMDQIIFTEAIIKGNRARKIMQIEYPTALTQIIFLDSFIQDNYCSDGAVVAISDIFFTDFYPQNNLEYHARTEKIKMYETPEVEVSQNLVIKNTTVSGNQGGSQIESKTAVFTVDTVHQKQQPWFNFLILESYYKDNQGKLSNEMALSHAVANLTILKSRWDVGSSTRNHFRFAQIVHKQYAEMNLTVEDSVFNCIEQDFDHQIVMQYSTDLSDGRASLFWINGNYGHQQMPYLNPHGKTLEQQGLLDPTTFNNVFKNNLYSNCNNGRRGAIFSLHRAAKVSDSGSTYEKNSALEGGVAFAEHQGTYLWIGDGTKFIENKAYFGGVYYGQQGATMHLENSVRIQDGVSYQGTIAFLIDRAHFIMKNDVQVTGCEVKNRGLIVSQAGCQFWLAGTQFIDSFSFSESAIIYVQGSRELMYTRDGSLKERISESSSDVTGTPGDGSTIVEGQHMDEYEVVINEKMSVYIIDSVIIRPLSIKGRLITMQDSNLYMKNVTFKSIADIFEDNHGIVMTDSELIVEDSLFYGANSLDYHHKLYNGKIGNINGAFISAYAETNMTIINTIFMNARANQGGCINILGFGHATIKYSNFTQCSAMVGGAIYSDGIDEMKIINTSFADNMAYQGVGQNIYFSGARGALLVENSTLISYHNSLYFAGEQLTAQFNVFNGSEEEHPVKQLHSRPNGGGIFVERILVMKLYANNFTNLIAKQGGAIYYNEDTNAVSTLEHIKGLEKFYEILIVDNNFVGCEAYENGGAVYLKNVNKVDFYGGSLQGRAGENGGGIYFYCEEVDTWAVDNYIQECDMQIQSVSFNSCHADMQGGGLYWNFIEPKMGQKPREDLEEGAFNTVTFASLEFINCTATKYGPQISGRAQELILLENRFEFEDYYNVSSTKRQLPFRLEGRRFLRALYYFDVQSGGFVPATYLALIDQYGQVVHSNIGGKINYQLNVNPDQIDQTSVFTTNLIGFRDFYSMFGVYNASGMEIVSKPGDMVPLIMNITGIDVNVPVVKRFLMKQQNSKDESQQILFPYGILIPIQVHVRACKMGEGLKNSGACFECPPGTYLLSPPKSPMECIPCPIGRAICLGNTDIGPEVGWWRLRNTTYNFYKCPTEQACLGMNQNLPIDIPGNQVGICNIKGGYYGALCASCLPGFQKEEDECVKCSEYAIYLKVFYLCLMAYGLSKAITYAIGNANNENNGVSVFVKILLNHLQMQVILASFQMKWPEHVVFFFNLASPIKRLTSVLTNFDCWMDMRDPTQIDYYDFYPVPGELRVSYKKLMVSAALPITLMLISYCAWFVQLKRQAKLKDLETRFVSSMVLLLFMVHPTITNDMIDMFDCAIYEEENRLKIDLQVICGEGLHWYFSYLLAFPGILIWGIGIPATILIMMQRVAGDMETFEVKEKFGFLYNGYKRHNYFWEIVIMYRKIICIFVAVFLKKIGIIVQALVLLIILCLFMQANASSRPYLARALNDIESMSLATQIVTVYCGIFFISGKDAKKDQIDKNQDFVLYDEYKMFFFLIILVCNLSFFFLWLTKFAGILRESIRTRPTPDLYVYLFLCGRFGKFPMQAAITAREVKKEAIIESIETVQLYMNKMKRLYVNNIFYQDHGRFLKLLYYIETERVQVDLTEKVNNYYIQGIIARHRKFDPERIKEAKDLKELAINSNFVHEMEEARRSSSQVKDKSNSQLGAAAGKAYGNILTLQKTQNLNVVELEPTASGGLQRAQTAPDDPELLSAQTIQIDDMGGPEDIDINTPSKKVAFPSTHKGDVSAITYENAQDQDQAEWGEDYVEEELNEEGSKMKKVGKKATKKPNVADLNAIITKSRERLNPFRAQKKQRVHEKQVDLLTGLPIQGELPAFLQGFQDYYKKPTMGMDFNESQTQMLDKLKMESIDSLESRIHFMRKLTERENQNDSPDKTASLVKQQTEKTVDLDTNTEINQTRGESSLPVYQDDQKTEGKDFNPDEPPAKDEDEEQEGEADEGEDEDEDDEEDSCADYEVMRPPGFPKRCLNADGQVVDIQGMDLHAEKPQEDEHIDSLEISIVNENGEFEVKRPEQHKIEKAIEEEQGAQEAKKGIFPPLLRQTIHSHKQPSKEINISNTTSFHTDSSMRDFDDFEDDQMIGAGVTVGLHSRNPQIRGYNNQFGGQFEEPVGSGLGVKGIHCWFYLDL